MASVLYFVTVCKTTHQVFFPFCCLYSFAYNPLLEPRPGRYKHVNVLPGFEVKALNIPPTDMVLDMDLYKCPPTSEGAFYLFLNV